ncbi:MAG TPA: YciI family protein [Candidatus Paceibacterota bacterium]|nr:YciI family protein [Candidatus Paceibacterota bacterium]
MKKFFVLYKAPIEEFTAAMKKMTPEDQQKSKAEWQEWMTKHKADTVDMGAPVGKTKAVTRTGTSDIKNDIGGYSIVQAESHDAATKIFTDSPHLKRMNGSIEVMEIMEM